MSCSDFIRIVGLWMVSGAMMCGAAWAAPLYIQGSDGGGMIAIEAERFSASHSIGGHRWEITNGPAGFVGTGAVVALPDLGTNVDRGDGPVLSYRIHFLSTGTHYVWVRGLGRRAGDSFHLDIDVRGVESLEEFELENDRWAWVNEADGDPAWFEVTRPALHTLTLHTREDGACVDRIVITTDRDFRPTGTGPDESSTGGVVHFGSPISSALETVGAVEIPVLLATGREESYSVAFTVSGGSGDRSDYDGAEGRLVFGAAQRVQTIRVGIVSDDLDEPDETVVTRLLNPTGPDVRLEAWAEHTVTILDPRPKVSFRTRASGEFEWFGGGKVEVELSAAYDEPVSVAYEVEEGSAKIGGDFLVEERVLQFAPGERRGAIPVRVVADRDREGEE